MLRAGSRARMPQLTEFFETKAQNHAGGCPPGGGCLLKRNKQPPPQPFFTSRPSSLLIGPGAWRGSDQVDFCKSNNLKPPIVGGGVVITARGKQPAGTILLLKKIEEQSPLRGRCSSLHSGRMSPSPKRRGTSEWGQCILPLRMHTTIHPVGKVRGTADQSLRCGGMVTAAPCEKGVRFLRCRTQGRYTTCPPKGSPHPPKCGGRANGDNVANAAVRAWQ
jgi:hypothetical protein